MDIFALKKLVRNEFFSEIIEFSMEITNQGFWYNNFWYNLALQKNMTHCEWLL